MRLLYNDDNYNVNIPSTVRYMISDKNQYRGNFLNKLLELYSMKVTNSLVFKNTRWTKGRHQFKMATNN